MATAEMNRMVLWTDLEDTVVADRWRLTRLIRPEGRIAWFQAATAEGKPVMLSITETLNDDDELLARLRAASEIRHPNLIRILDAVASRIDDSPVVIAAMEMTEENLDDVLRDRALSPAEAQVVLDALVQGIAAIHARGLVHGRMEPSSVLAIGDLIKLRTDCLLIPESGFAAAAAANVQGVGRIATRAVTRRDPFDENDPVVQLLPDPMARAVRRALTGHARIDEIASLAGIRIIPARDPEPEPKQPAPLSGSASVPQAASAEAPKPLGEKVAARVESKLAAPQVPAPKAPEPPAEARQSSLFAEPEVRRDLSHLLVDDEEDEPAWRRSLTKTRVAGAAAVILLITIVALYALLHRTPAKSAQHADAAPVVITQQAHPVTATSAPAVHAKAPAAPASQAGWRVIVYTYDRQADAQHKADALAQKYPQLQPGIFSLHGRSPWLVTLGGVMSKDQASALRKQAVHLGLPRDSYAQNFRR